MPISLGPALNVYFESCTPRGFQKNIAAFNLYVGMRSIFAGISADLLETRVRNTNLNAAKALM
jgi:hypothetical protein